MQLYDLASDPRETANLVEEPQYKLLVRRLKEKMRSYMDNGRSTPGKPQKNEGRQEWEFTGLF